MKEISVKKLQSIIEKGDSPFIIDVRDRIFFDEGHIKGALNVPAREIEDFIPDIPENKDVYVICKAGNSSYNAVSLLNELDVLNCVNVRGGMLSYTGTLEKTVK